MNRAEGRGPPHFQLRVLRQPATNNLSDPPQRWVVVDWSPRVRNHAAFDTPTGETAARHTRAHHFSRLNQVELLYCRASRRVTP
jgi:hypothetical protein